MKNETMFSQAQLDFLKFVWTTLKGKAVLIGRDSWFDLFLMKDGIPTWEERVYTEFVVAPDVRMERGMLYAIQFIWSEDSCQLHQRINLHEPYFDEDIYIGENSDGGTDYGDMVYKDSIHIGPVSWIQAAMMLYRMIGIPEKANRVKFVELVKAL